MLNKSINFLKKTDPKQNGSFTLAFGIWQVLI